MHIYIDESGDFNPLENKENFYASVCIQTTQWKLAMKEKQFTDWKDAIPPIKLNAQWEVKWKDLDNSEILNFIKKVILSEPIIFINACSINPTGSHDFSKRKESVISELNRAISIYESQDKVDLAKWYKGLKKRYTTLSTVQFIKIETLMSFIHDTFLVFYKKIILDENDNELWDISIYIDTDSALFKNNGTRRDYWRRFTKDALYQMTYQEPFPMIDSWDENHPFKKLIRGKDWIERVSTIYRERLHFELSNNKIWLQIADIISHIFYRSFNKTIPSPIGWKIRKIMGEVIVWKMNQYIFTSNKWQDIPNPYAKT